MPYPPAGQTFTSCLTEAQLASAVAAQGTITFSENAETRFFTDSGGTLGTAGAAGKAGAAGATSEAGAGTDPKSN